MVNFPTSYDAKMYKTRGNAVFVQCAADFLASNKGEMEKKLCTMTEENAEFNIPKKSTSLISRTYKALCDSFVINLDFGPFYAKRMLFGGNNQNLIHAVDGYIVKNNEISYMSFARVNLEMTSMNRRRNVWIRQTSRVRRSAWKNT